MSGSDEAVDELAERLEGVLEELTDMALDALRLASAGDPDAAETGEALALETRIESEDACDAIAVAICHATRTSTALRLGVAR